MPNEETTRYWNEEGGQAWIDQQARFDAQLAPFVDLLVAGAAPQPGEAVVDVGCGSGALSRHLDSAVQPGGRVLGVDVSAPMLEAARADAAAVGSSSRYLEADAQVADLRVEGPFDLVASRFGVMFFDDPVAAFANIAAAAVDGGRLVFVCWQAFERNPWMHVPMTAALQHLPAPPLLDPAAPGPFAFADPHRVRSILGAAGYQSIEVASVEPELTLAGWGDVDDALRFLQVTSMGRLLLSNDDPDVQERVLAAVRASLQPHVTAEGVRFGSAAWLVTARTDGR